jgi:hypothetical protein
MRKFETYSDDKKIATLIFALGLALTAPQAERKSTRDIFELAANYGKLHGLKAPDFNLIKHETISQLITKIKP